MSVLLFIFHNSAAKMKNIEKTKKALAFAFPRTIPIMIGFIFLGMSYGVYMSVPGFDFRYPLIMSMLIYGGSLEFMAVSMLLSPFATLEAFLTALILQARHIFYGNPCSKNTEARGCSPRCERK